MKRIIKFGIILSLILIVISANISIYATTNNINSPSAKSEIVINDISENQIQVIVNINDLENIGEGVNAYTGVLEYNSNELEFVEFINVNNWNNPTYKILDNGIKLVSTSNKFLKEDNIVFKATFNKKVSKDSYDVQISKLELAAKVNDGTEKVIASNQNTIDMEPITINNSMNIVIMCIVLITIIIIIYIISKKFKGGR